MRKTISSLAAVGLILALSACGSDTTTTGVYANQGAKIGLAMPADTSARWIADSTAMADQFRAMGYVTTTKFANIVSATKKLPDSDAAGQVANQKKQVQAMIDDGDKLLVISDRRAHV